MAKTNIETIANKSSEVSTTIDKAQLLQNLKESAQVSTSDLKEWGGTPFVQWEEGREYNFVFTGFEVLDTPTFENPTQIVAHLMDETGADNLAGDSVLIKKLEAWSEENEKKGADKVDAVVCRIIYTGVVQSSENKTRKYKNFRVLTF